MRPELTKGYSQYGAQVGRGSDKGDEESRKMYLRAIGPDSGGYDEQGAYWGSGPAVYWATDGEVDYFTRQYSREDAKEAVLEEFPNARFFR